MWYSSFWSERSRNHLNWQTLAQNVVPRGLDSRSNLWTIPLRKRASIFRHDKKSFDVSHLRAGDLGHLRLHLGPPVGHRHVKAVVATHLGSMQMTITNGNWPFHQPSLSNESKQWEGIHPWSESQSLDGIPLKIQSWLFFLFTYDHSSSPCQGSFCSNEEVIYSHLLRHDLKLLKYKLFLGCMSNIQSTNYRSKISNPVDIFGLQLRYYRLRDTLTQSKFEFTQADRK